MPRAKKTKILREIQTRLIKKDTAFVDVVTIEGFVFHNICLKRQENGEWLMYLPYREVNGKKLNYWHPVDAGTRTAFMNEIIEHDDFVNAKLKKNSNAGNVH